MGPKPPFAAGTLLVTVSDDVRIRSKPRVSSDSVIYEPVLATGTDLLVLAGPVAGSGYWWYRVRLQDGLTLSGGIATGWVAAGDHDGEPWIDWPEVDTDSVPERGYPELTVPVLISQGTEDYVGSDGNPYTRYDLSVVNWADYPAELFTSEPDLEPCGLNSSASRTWVDIVDADQEQRIYGFCALADPQGLTGIWFAVPRGTAPPSSVYVVLWDRLYDRSIESKPVSPPSLHSASPTPSPSLVIPKDATLDAALARCPTRDEVALVNSVLLMTFEDDPTRPDLVCTAAGGSADLTHQQERAYQAVLSMRRIPFDAPLPWTDLPLFDWFAQEVNGIIFRETELSYCCDDEGVIAIRSDTNFSNSWSDLWVGRDPNAAIGLMNNVDLLLHEARHVDGFPHTCPAGGDDATLDEGGAWAVVYWYYVWLSEHADSPYMAPVDAEPDVYTRAAANQAAATLVRIGCD